MNVCMNKSLHQDFELILTLILLLVYVVFFLLFKCQPLFPSAKTITCLLLSKQLHVFQLYYIIIVIIATELELWQNSEASIRHILSTML